MEPEKEFINEIEKRALEWVVTSPQVSEARSREGMLSKEELDRLQDIMEKRSYPLNFSRAAQSFIAFSLRKVPFPELIHNAGRLRFLSIMLGSLLVFSFLFSLSGILTEIILPEALLVVPLLILIQFRIKKLREPDYSTISKPRRRRRTVKGQETENDLLPVKKGLYRHEPASGVQNLSFSPDGKLLAFGSESGQIWLMDTGSGKITSEIYYPYGDMKNLFFSPDGNTLFASSALGDFTVRVWNVKTGSETACFLHNAAVSNLALSPDGRWLAAGGEETGLFLYRTKDWQEVFETEEISNIRALAFGPVEGQLLISTARRDLLVWDVRTQKTLKKQTFEQDIDFLVLSPDGKYLGLKSLQGDLRVLQTSDWKEIYSGTVQNIHAAGPALVLKNRSRRLWAGFGQMEDDCGVFGLDFTQGQQAQVYPTRLPVGALALDPQQELLAAGCGDYSGSYYAAGQIWLFETDSGELKSWMLAGGPVWDLVFSPDGKLLAAGDDSGLTVWDVEKYLS